MGRTPGDRAKAETAGDGEDRSVGTAVGRPGVAALRRWNEPGNGFTRDESGGLLAAFMEFVVPIRAFAGLLVATCGSSRKPLPECHGSEVVGGPRAQASGLGFGMVANFHKLAPSCFLGFRELRCLEWSRNAGRGQKCLPHTNREEAQPAFPRMP